MNMASKDKYKSLLERYKQALIKNPKLNLSAYCRLNGVSVSGMHHYIEDVGQSVKSIRDAVLKATEHQNCEAFVPFTTDSELSDAASYFNNEWEAVVDIFKRGDTALDNNLVERMNRYFSMSRRGSLFFGSHKGAERAAVLYTLALSAKMNHLNLFDYLADILDRTAQWQPNTPLENYRNLLPGLWQPSTKD